MNQPYQTPSIHSEYSYHSHNSAHHHQYLLPSLLKLMAPQKKASPVSPRVLDLGCGNGSLSHAIAQQGYQVVGIEESESGIQIATQSFPECQFIQGSIYDLQSSQLKDKFDIILAAEVIEHLFYPKALIRVAKQLLKPTGQLILTTPYHGYLKNLVLALSGKMDRHFTALWDGGHIKFFSVATLTSLLQSEGFTDINFKFAGRVPYLWKTMLCSSRIGGN